ncbi:unnamed protein product [Anisakis simplex]|uniref:DUF736 domain-containing protein n=1 Tax=Anisakis simplex TaxID=6269 RepID=A0A0M3J6Z1_ANISI|nr:unnamed protein product [Anisakis simplex]
MERDNRMTVLGSAQEADTLEKRGGGRPFTLVNEKRGGARFFKIQDPDDIEKRAGGRPFYINVRISF